MNVFEIELMYGCERGNRKRRRGGMRGDKGQKWKAISCILVIVLVVLLCLYLIEIRNNRMIIPNDIPTNTSPATEITETKDTQSKDALSLWTDDAKLKTELVNYINAITDENSKDFIPIENRYAAKQIQDILIINCYTIV